jgi:hypothetical protein
MSWHRSFKFAQRFVCPLSLREITRDLAAVFWQLSRMASRCIRVWVRENEAKGRSFEERPTCLADHFMVLENVGHAR